MKRMATEPERSILVVDDEAYVLEALKRALAHEGFQLVTSHDPEAALRLLKSRKFHVIVSDYNMPRMMGPDFLARARELSPQSIRVVLTGNSDLKVVQQFMTRGEAMRYLLKPWDTAELKATLQECLELGSEAA